MNITSNPFQTTGSTSDAPLEDPNIDGPKVPIEELISFARHAKLTQMKAAIDYLPNKKFDNTLVQVKAMMMMMIIIIIIVMILMINYCDDCR